MDKNKKPVSPVKGAHPTSKTAANPAQKNVPVPQKSMDFAFSKENYRLMLIGLAFIVIGYILMIGGGSKDPNDFSPAIFDFQRITLAPILILAGYVIEIFAIMKKPKD
jgi:hypothetical protein